MDNNTNASSSTMTTALIGLAVVILVIVLVQAMDRGVAPYRITRLAQEVHGPAKCGCGCKEGKTCTCQNCKCKHRTISPGVPMQFTESLKNAVDRGVSFDKDPIEGPEVYVEFASIRQTCESIASKVGRDVVCVHIDSYSVKKTSINNVLKYTLVFSLHDKESNVTMKVRAVLLGGALLSLEPWNTAQL